MLSAWLYGTSVHHFVAVAIALAYVLSVAPSRLSLRGPLVLASTIAIRKSKTQAGQRMIPLNDDALGAIRALPGPAIRTLYLVIVQRRCYLRPSSRTVPTRAAV
jgi:hypothetical protein